MNDKDKLEILTLVRDFASLAEQVARLQLSVYQLRNRMLQVLESKAPPTKPDGE